MKFRVKHTFTGIGLAEYEELYFDEQFNIELYQDAKLERIVQRRELQEGHLVRETTVGPDRELPGPVAKALGTNKLSYTEHIDYRFGSYQGTWVSVPSAMAKRVTCKGTFGFKDADPGLERWVEGEVSVKVIGLGGYIERAVVADIEKTYQKVAAFMQRWIDAKRV